MRDIKFRGKRADNGERVYGDLEYNRAKGIARIHSYDDNGNYIGQNVVDESTVGQFTGLKDCNGNDIYEGDIVKVTQIRPKDLAPIDRGTCVVSFSPWYGWSVGTDMVRYEIEARTKLGAIDKVEVVGNKFDNPDLLK